MSPTSTLGSEVRYVDLVTDEAIPLIKTFFHHLEHTDQQFFLMDQIEKQLDEFLSVESAINGRVAAGVRRLFNGCQEIILWHGYTYAVLRPRIGVRRIVRLHPDEDKFEEVSRGHYLEVKDAYVQGPELAARKGLVLDFAPFFRDFPKVKEPAAMGRGTSLLNRHLSSQMYQNPTVFQRAMIQFLQNAHLAGNNILVNEHLSTPDRLLTELETTRGLLSDMDPETPYEAISHQMRSQGFEPGWGKNAASVLHNLTMLAHVMEASEPEKFEAFLGRLPLTRKVLMVSPHGWFAQKDVLGKPDTGGQVTYVLDQARALEKRMLANFEESGVSATPHILILTRLIPDAEGTTCNEPLERVVGSQNCWIVRVPFRDNDGNVIPNWISRFHIWPYIEQFSDEARDRVLSEFMGRPHLVVGHYTDGNLVGHLLAEEFGVTHCAAVHALEKTKYLFSDMRWADMETDYNFSLHFTADILSYNSADFIISSSYREIGGTNKEMGMFESYESFSMPGLYRVVSGMDPQLARYNIVPPGASEEHFFPYTEEARRPTGMAQELADALLQADPGESGVGRLDEPEKPVIFAMSRVDRVKNLPGLIEVYGRSQRLQDTANLVILSSITDASQSQDHEEIDQINRMYDLINHYNLHGRIRWAGVRLGKAETGEVYRLIAERGGVFAQPALMETFGLTVIEAMSCGCPVVVTCFGGPSEIVVPGESGEVADPNDFEAFGEALYGVLSDSARWEKLSHGGMRRVAEAYSWDTHAYKVLGLANTYSYWNYLDVMNRSALDRYIHTLYHTIYRQRATAMAR